MGGFCARLHDQAAAPAGAADQKKKGGDLAEFHKKVLGFMNICGIFNEQMEIFIGPLTDNIHGGRFEREREEGDDD